MDTLDRIIVNGVEKDVEAGADMAGPYADERARRERTKKEMAETPPVAEPFGNDVTANPALAGTEPELTGLEVNGAKYKVPSGGSLPDTTSASRGDVLTLGADKEPAWAAAEFVIEIDDSGSTPTTEAVFADIKAAIDAKKHIVFVGTSGLRCETAFSGASEGTYLAQANMIDGESGALMSLNMSATENDGVSFAWSAYTLTAET